MKKSDLIDGHIVTLRNRKRYRFDSGAALFESLSGSRLLENYDNNLLRIHREEKEYDIMQIQLVQKVSERPREIENFNVKVEFSSFECLVEYRDMLNRELKLISHKNIPYLKKFRDILNDKIGKEITKDKYKR